MHQKFYLPSLLLALSALRLASLHLVIQELVLG